MKNRRFFRMTVLVLVLVMAAASLAGCSKNSNNSQKSAETDTRFQQIVSPLSSMMEYGAEDEDGGERYNFLGTTAAGGNYYVLYTDSESEAGAFLSIFDEGGKNERKVELPVFEEGSITNFCVTPQEEIILLLSYSDYEEEVYHSQIVCYSIEGGESPELSEKWKALVSEGADFIPSGMIAAGSEIVILTDSEMRIYDSQDGSEKKKMKTPGDFFGFICKNPAEEILLVGSGGNGVVCHKYNAEKEDFEKIQFELSDLYMVNAVGSGCGGYDFFVVSDDSVYGCSLDQPNPVRIMDFLMSDLEVDSASGYAAVSTESAVMLYYNMDYVMEASLFKKASGQGEENKTTLTLGTLYADTKLRREILNFNKTSEHYRVILKEYPFDDEGNNTLSMEIASGNVPDMICISEEMPVESYAAKGLFEDLEPLFEADEELSSIEYLNNVLDAFRIDGKMYYITPSFNVIGLIGKKKDFGSTRGVTTGQIEKMMKERNIGFDTVMGITSREDMLSWVMYCAMDEYVDWDAGTCSFGSDSFVNLLKFCSKFPKSINYENVNFAKYETAMREGKQLLRDGYLFNFDIYMQERYGYIGEELTFMGYPGNGENGPVVQSELSVAISHNCTDREGCWEFLRRFYLEDYQEKIDDAFPVSKTALLNMAEDAMNPELITYTDENGKEVTEPETSMIYINEQEVKIPVPKQEDIDTVMNLLASLDSKASIDSKISEIVTEESGAFFAGQKSAEETADIIQSRVKVYISETR